MKVTSPGATFGLSFFTMDDVTPDLAIVQFRPSTTALAGGAVDQPPTPLL